MKIRRFVAADMRGALQLVREAHGPDAVILSNRRTDEGIEIVAASNYDEDFVQRAIEDTRRETVAASAPPAPAPVVEPSPAPPVQATAPAPEPAPAGVAAPADPAPALAPSEIWLKSLSSPKPAFPEPAAPSAPAADTGSAATAEGTAAPTALAPAEAEENIDGPTFAELLAAG